MGNMTEITILDVGCGDRPRGTTNLDLTERDVDNFILGDATDLPFDDNSFDSVYSSGLSLWSTHFDNEKIIKSWQEAIRVARHQVVFEYNYNKPNENWNPKDPFQILEVLKEELARDINIEYSERGKFANVIKPFEKLFGRKMTVFLLNNIIRRSYYVKFKLNLSEKTGVPETILEFN